MANALCQRSPLLDLQFCQRERFWNVLQFSRQKVKDVNFELRQAEYEPALTPLLSSQGYP